MSLAANFVLDSSIALAWCFSDEQTEDTAGLLERLACESAVVPALWSLEIGNILIVAERRKRISFADINRFLELLGRLNIKVDSDTANKAFHEILHYAYTQNLTTYDAAYLDLAVRMGLPLASKDPQLCDAAKKLGVEVLKMN